MASDPHDIFRIPVRRLRAEEGEFRWQPLRPLDDEVDIGVDAGRERRGDRLRVGRIGGPLGFHRAAIEEMPGSEILGEVTRSEVGGEEAEPAFAPEVDLPQPVTRRIEPLEEEEVGLAVRLDVRNAPAVDPDLARFRQTGQ